MPDAKEHPETNSRARDERPRTWPELSRKLRKQAGRYKSNLRRAYLLANAVSWRGMAWALASEEGETAFVSDVKGAGEYGSNGAQALRDMAVRLDELRSRLKSAADTAAACEEAALAPQLVREIRHVQREGERAYNLAGVVASAQKRLEALRTMEGRKCFPEDVQSAAESVYAVKELEAFASDLFDAWTWTKTLADQAEAIQAKA